MTGNTYLVGMHCFNGSESYVGKVISQSDDFIETQKESRNGQETFIFFKHSIAYFKIIKGSDSTNLYIYG